MAVVTGIIFAAWLTLASLEQKFLKLPRLVHMIGAGMVALLFAFADPNRLVLIVTATFVVGRASMIALVWVSRPAAEGLAIGRSLRTSVAIVAILAGAGAALACGIRPAIVMIFASYISIRGIREYWYKRRGGIDGLAMSLTLRENELATVLIGLFIS